MAIATLDAFLCLLQVGLETTVLFLALEVLGDSVGDFVGGGSDGVGFYLLDLGIEVHFEVGDLLYDFHEGDDVLFELFDGLYALVLEDDLAKGGLGHRLV